MISDKLGLQPTGVTTVSTANGESIENTYLINIILPSLDSPNKIRMLDVNASEGNLGPDVDMLIGMDVISIGDFAVENEDGKTRYSFCLPPFAERNSKSSGRVACRMEILTWAMAVLVVLQVLVALKVL